MKWYFVLPFFIFWASFPLNNEDQKSMEMVGPVFKDDRGPKWANEESLTQIYISSVNTLQRNRGSKSACNRLNELKNDNNFPLKDLATIKHLEYCLNYYTDVLDNYPEWVAVEYLNAAIIYALRIDNPELLASIYLELSKVVTIKTDKLEYVNMALALNIRDEVKVKLTDRLYTLSPSLRPNIEKSDYMAVAADLDSLRNYEDANIYYQRIISSNDFSINDQLRAWKRVVRNSKLMRNQEAYIANNEKFIKFLKKNNLTTELNENEIILARALWTSERVTEAIRKIDQLLKNDTLGAFHKAQGLRYLGLINLQTGKNKIAENYLLESLQVRGISKSFYNDILWDIAYYYYTNKNYTQSIIHLEKLAQDKNYYTAQRGKFWLAKASKQLRRISKARELFRELATTYPYDYYGIVSIYELGDSYQPLPTICNYEEFDPTFDWLLTLGEFSLAKNRLQILAQKKRKPEDILQLLKAYNRAKYYEGGINLFYRVNVEDRPKILDTCAITIFPSSSENILNKITTDLDLDTAIPLSIIRQESAFNVYAKSPADAFGLMQVIPEKALDISTRYKIRYNSYLDLYDEATNLRIGSVLLKELLERFNNNFVFTTASYNAGEHVVDKWRAKYKDFDFIEFIEKIPYAETQNYVKLLTRNFIIYRRLNTTEPFLFPEHLFKIK